MNIMTLAFIGIIIYMFTRKKETGVEPSEPSVHTIALGTGTVKTAVTVKGGVKVIPSKPKITHGEWRRI